ncbi:MAG: GAF domain-containing protein [Bacteroidota bacterium]
MIRLFLNFKLRIKLLLAFGSLLILTVLLVSVFFQTLTKIETYEKASEEVDGVNIDILEMDAHVKYFIFEGYKHDTFQATHQSPHLEQYLEHLMLVRKRLESLDQLMIHHHDSLISPIRKTLFQTEERISQLKKLLVIRGFKDYGLEGKLRSAIHVVEKSSFSYDKSDMLMLRRHEKDFFLRKDLKYQQEFNSKLQNFVENIESGSGGIERLAILENLQNYQKQFNEIVEIETQIGLKENSGIKGTINHDLSKLKQLILQLRADIKATSSNFKQTAVVRLSILFGIEIILGVLLAIVYADIITRAIKELHRAMHTLSEGRFPPILVVRSNEEIGKTKLAFNQLLDRLKAATQFAEALGQGNLKTAYEDQFADDILARALIRMQSQLADASEKQRIANWVNSGMAQLNDVIKNEAAEIGTLGDQLLKLLINYLNANQGALYLLETDEHDEYLGRISTYAYGKKKFIDSRVELGQGLVGQCVLEKSTIVMTNVPEDYVKITSGLGGAVPRFLIILPLRVHEHVMGVLELASFAEFLPYQIQFLEKISENIASLLAHRKITAETKKLLSEAQQHVQQAAAQKEEIRQNAEELQAIQEQLTRENKLLENEIAELRRKLSYQTFDVLP